MRTLFACAFYALGLVSLSTAPDAQIFGPSVDSASSTLWFEPGRISIRGSNLGFVDRVTVDGVEVPILRNTGARITIRPPATTEPGFATIEVFDAQGSDSVRLAYAPVLEVARQGNRMDVTLDNGAPGAYRLAYSFEPLDTPTRVPGIRHGLSLDLESSFSGILASGILVDRSRFVLERMRVPREPSLIGQPVFVQFLGQQGLGAGHAQFAGELRGEGTRFRAPTRSFSNLVQVPDRPIMQPGG